ncbi:glycosyltransferase family 2 protein [Levilactobacillus bambusae]|uniref:Glycosyltransferase n=1 Tax=Levilactobacillus bambusae TaxID=2024736 RepID=A0A2V1MXR1_9LACO|nr:glycosyltransferase family 2 protein [Levilactobacillus bambusae]PWF99786.1 glycosyltransferase [Levilactobacillus bambusae]
MNHKHVTAVIVTYNRLDWLKQCLMSVKNQTRKPDRILVIDNASTDGTDKYFETEKDDQVTYIRKIQNTGGAGGFNYGLRKAVELGTDYEWIMDDDTIPTQTALEELLVSDERLQGNWSFLASNVRWQDNTPAVMNQLQTSDTWATHVDKGVIEVQSGTFVSILVKTQLVKQIGLPISDFFIWGDDTEYTLRLAQIQPGYFVSNSIVIHEIMVNERNDIISENNKLRLKRYFYSMRNSFYIARREGKGGIYFIKKVILSFSLIKNTKKYKWRKFSILYKGLFAGMFFNPKIEKVE